MIKENNPREVAGVTDRETRLRGYRYSYDALGRLTEALYGENTALSANPQPLHGAGARIQGQW